MASSSNGKHLSDDKIYDSLYNCGDRLIDDLNAIDNYDDCVDGCSVGDVSAMG
jgi:hypothetical protein